MLLQYFLLDEQHYLIEAVAVELVTIKCAGFYRYLRSRDLHEEEMCVRSAIQGVALQHDGHYGYRRITAELRRAGMLVNHKRVSGILREDSLIAAALAEPRKKPRPDMMVNLAGGMQVTGINQL